MSQVLSDRYPAIFIYIEQYETHTQLQTIDVKYSNFKDNIVISDIPTFDLIHWCYKKYPDDEDLVSQITHFPIRDISGRIMIGFI